MNPEHPAVKKIREIFEKDAKDARVEAYAKLLLDQALIAEGSTIKDPAGFARRVNELIAGCAACGVETRPNGASGLAGNPREA